MQLVLVFAVLLMDVALESPAAYGSQEKNVSTALESMKQQNSTLHSRLTSLDTKVEGLKKALESMKHQNSTLHSRPTSLDTKVEGLKKALESMKQQNSILHSRLTSLDTKVEGLKKAFALLKDGVRIGNKLFVSTGDRANYKDAINICAKLGAQLATPRNAKENAAVLKVRGTSRTHAWLGINKIRTKPTFKYISNQPLTYTNWGPGEPNKYMGRGEDCAEMWETGKWNDNVCNERDLVICEF